MKDSIISSADEVALFCRLQMNTKRELPIRPSEMGVLIYIKTQGEPVTPLMVSNFFKIAKPSVTAMVSSLIKKDYLVKIPSPIDGRSYMISITNKADELVKTTYSEYFKSMELLEEKMGYEDFEVFIKLLKKANKILSEERGIWKY